MRDIELGETVYFNFTTRAFATGVPTVLLGTPVLEVLEENNATPIATGVTVQVDRASVVGLNQVTIVATSGNGYEVGKSYSVYIATGTVDSVSAIGEVVAQFTVEASAARQTLGAVADGAAAGDVTTSDTLIGYTKQLINVLMGTPGIGTFPASSVPGNAISMAEVLRQIYDNVVTVNTVADGIQTDLDNGTDGLGAIKTSVDTIPTTAMRGTDNAALASVCTETRLAELDAANLPTDIADIPTVTEFDARTILAANYATAANLDLVPAIITSGSADNGNTSQMVDAVRTEADDYWNGMELRFTSGPNAGLSRPIANFTAASDAMDIQPPFPNAIASGHSYEILPASIHSDVELIGLDAQSQIDLKDFVDAGYNPATNKVTGVSLVDNLTTYIGNTLQTGDVITAINDLANGIDGLTALKAAIDLQATLAICTETRLSELDAANLPTDIAALPTVAEFNARTVLSASYALEATVGALNDLSLADVRTILGLETDNSIAELSVGIPAATPSLAAAIMLPYMFLRNKGVITTAQLEIYNDAATLIAKGLVTDATGTFTKDELISG